MSNGVATQRKISIPKAEYIHLKKLEARFGAFLKYFEYVNDIREAREEVKSGKLIAQEKLFRKLGF